MDSILRNKYKAVIGLEVHAQLSTNSKIFAADAVSFGDEPNSNISVVSLAHPGTLPKLNKKTIEYAIKMGLACHSKISPLIFFDRKNYFYPDLPKGYQLTQDKTPICIGGYVTIKTKSGEKKNILLNRIHLEEDAGKLIHTESGNKSLVDFNRAGTPLIEIVTEPVLRNAEEAAAFLVEVRKLVRYLEICDGNMEEGSLRCDANVSVKLNEATELGKKVELKNINSFRNVQRAIDFEIARQIDELENGKVIVSETRTFDANNGKTYGMRTKEELNDYRYFPDPDVSPVAISDEWLQSIKASMPILPRELLLKFVQHYKLPAYDAEVLTESKDVAIYFEEIATHTNNFKAASNWVMGPIKSYLNDAGIAIRQFPISPAVVAELIQLIDEGKISFTVATQTVLPSLMQHPTQSALVVAQQLNVMQDSNQDYLLAIVNEVINEFPLKVKEFKNGKKGIATMFVGEVMKRSKAKADPKLANQLIEKKLSEL